MRDKGSSTRPPRLLSPESLSPRPSAHRWVKASPEGQTCSWDRMRDEQGSEGPGVCVWRAQPATVIYFYPPRAKTHPWVSKGQPVRQGWGGRSSFRGLQQPWLALIWPLGRGEALPTAPAAWVRPGQGSTFFTEFQGLHGAGMSWTTCPGTTGVEEPGAELSLPPLPPGLPLGVLQAPRPFWQLAAVPCLVSAGLLPGKLLSSLRPLNLVPEAPGLW